MVSPNELYEQIRSVYKKPDCTLQGCDGECRFFGRYNPTAGVKCNLSAIEYALKIKP